MTVSVIIVSYNVKYFLEQCLCSVERARQWEQNRTGREQVEVFVVDNDSTDGTVEYLQPTFPFVSFIVNRTNVGFAVANNQALKQAGGQYILFLNPDTILPEDFFEQCIRFMETHPDAGAMGVRMVDGSGKYLKESKRGIPTPWVAFCKMTGLTSLFPASKIFARYYLGHLSENETHPAEALAGACMLARKEVLQQTGGFDERFFMYAEDIDLSWRIQQAGYTNYYFHGCTIIHFKGESTRKDAHYIKLFYKAMVQFVEKHFSGKWSGISVALLKGAIRMRAAWAAVWKPRQSQPQHVVLHNHLYTAYVGYALTGEEDSMKELPLAGGVQKPTPAAPAIVFCEGPSFPFKKIIAALQQQPSRHKYIHGKGTASIVGSTSSNRQGHTFSW